MTAIFTLLNTGMYNALNAGNLATLAAGGIWDTNYIKEPADSPVDNYVIFQIQAGGDTNTSPRRDVDVIFRVEFISTSLANARAGAGYIDDLLHDQDLTLVGWSNYRMVAERLWAQDEVIGGKRWYRRGAFYRVEADCSFEYTWVKTYDFLLSAAGWISHPSYPTAVWTAGVGWHEETPSAGDFIILAFSTIQPGSQVVAAQWSYSTAPDGETNCFWQQFHSCFEGTVVNSTSTEFFVLTPTYTPGENTGIYCGTGAVLTRLTLWGRGTPA
jgi:hypothetical protein